MNPLDIYQRALDIVSDAIMRGDFDTYAAQIDLPFLILTYNGRHLITAVQDLRATLDNLSRAHALGRVPQAGWPFGGREATWRPRR